MALVDAMSCENNKNTVDSENPLLQITRNICCRETNSG